MSDPIAQYGYLVPVTFSQLLSGEDQINNWLATVNGANQKWPFKPLTVHAAAGIDTNTIPTTRGYAGMSLGAPGAVGDYVDKVIASVRTASNSRLLLQDITTPWITSTGSATWSSGTPTSFTFAYSSASSTAATVAALCNQYLLATYNVNSVEVVIPRRITAVTANAGVSYVLTIESPALTDSAGGAQVPASAVTNSATHFILPLIELLPPSAPVGLYTIPVQAKSQYGAWKIFVDSGVAATVIGKFS